GTGTTANSLSWAIKTANTDVVAASGHPGGGCTSNTITLKTDVTITGVMTRLIDSSLTLTSDSTTRTLSGNSAWRPLFVKSGTVTLKNLNLSNGKALGGNSWKGSGAGLGGALFIYDGAVAVQNVIFSNNTVQGGKNTGNREGGGGMGGNGGADVGGGLFASGDSGGYGGTGNYGGGKNRFGGGGYKGSTKTAGGFGGGGGLSYGTGGAGGFGGGGGNFGGNSGGDGGFGGGGACGGATGSAQGSGGYGGGSAGNGCGGGGAGFGGAIFVKKGSLTLQNVFFNTNSAIQGTGAATATNSNGNGKGGAIFVCTADLDSDSTAKGAKGGCSGTINEASSCGVTFSGGVAAQGQTDLFWKGASGGAHSTAGITDNGGCAKVISIAPATGTASADTTVNFTVTFNQAMTGVDASDFTLTKTGTASGTISTPTTSDGGVTWTVPVTNITTSSSGTLRMDLNDPSATGIVSTAAMSPASYTSGTTHTVEGCMVTQASDDGTGNTANTLSWAIKTANTDVVASSGHPGKGCLSNTITLKTDVTLTGVMKRLIDSSLTLTSDSTTRTINGGDKYRPLFIKSGTVTLKSLKLTKGRAQGSDGKSSGPGAGLGGALFVYNGTVAIQNVNFSYNTAKGGSNSQTGDASKYGGGGMG
ncbi:MAG: hypothetical protein WCG26_13560, partial [Chloroflexales bacterium]